MNNFTSDSKWLNFQEMLNSENKPMDLDLFKEQLRPSLIQSAIEDLTGGILLLTEQGELVYANKQAHQILIQLSQRQKKLEPLPQEIWHVYQALLKIRYSFPEQHWLFQSKIFLDKMITLQFQAQWITLETNDFPFLLFMVENEYKFTKNWVSQETQKYGLTAREKEIWALHRANYSYKQIAAKLTITPNTVKKHMKNILSKQKIAFEEGKA